MHLYVVTPLGVAIDRDGIIQLDVKSTTGWLGILSGHEDMITSLVPAVIHYTTKEHIYDLVITTGVMNIDHDKDLVTIVADALFYKNQIDIKVVSQLYENAQKRLAMVESNKEHHEIEMEMAELQAKMNLVDYPGRRRIK